MAVEGLGEAPLVRAAGAEGPQAELALVARERRGLVGLEELLRPRQRVELLSPMMALSFFRARCFKTSPRKNEKILEEENHCLITY